MTAAASAVGARRVFDGRRVWHLSEEGFRAAAALLADELGSEPPLGVVGIARGGLPLAQRLGRILGIPVVTVAARHNPSDAVGAQASGRVTAHATADAFTPVEAGSGAGLLVADDICGTGATLAAVACLVSERLRPRWLRTVTLCRNVGAVVEPDVWVWDVSDWVVFPWEVPPVGRAVESLPVRHEVRRRVPR